MKMNHQAKQFVRNIRWAVCFFLLKDKAPEKKERYGFKSLKNPEPQPLVEPFVDALYNIIKNIKFKKRTKITYFDYNDNIHYSPSLQLSGKGQESELLSQFL